MTSLSKPFYKYNLASVKAEEPVEWGNNTNPYLSHTGTTALSMRDVFSGAQPVGVTNLMENIKGLEFRLARVEASFERKLKEHEETVEMLLKVIKDAT